MRTAAVICELNPLHNGHAYLFKTLREKHGVDYLVALMSGNYVQRGEPAVFDKYLRTKAALLCGADLVFELPPVFAMSSSYEFAHAGIALAVKSGIVDILGFGTEPGLKKDTLEHAADILMDLPPEQDDTAPNEKLRYLIKTGYTYPAAREILFKERLDELAPGTIKTLFKPNNILAIEYITAIRHFQNQKDSPAHIATAAIDRIGDASESGLPGSSYTSASMLRDLIYTTDADAIAPFVPKQALNLYKSNVTNSIRRFAKADDLSSILSQRILETKYKNTRPLTDYYDVSREIAGRLLKSADNAMSFTQRVDHVKTKQYTYSRIQRSLLHIALGITKAEAEKQKNEGYVKYIRLLGFKESAQAILKALKANSSVPIITKASDHKELLSDSLLYDQMYYSLAGDGNELLNSPVIIS